MSRRNKKCEACSYDLRGAKGGTSVGRIPAKVGSLWSRPGVGGFDSEISGQAEFFPGSLLLLGVRGRFSPPCCTHRYRATVGNGGFCSCVSRTIA